MIILETRAPATAKRRIGHPFQTGPRRSRVGLAPDDLSVLERPLRARILSTNSQGGGDLESHPACLHPGSAAKCYGCPHALGVLHGSGDSLRHTAARLPGREPRMPGGRDHMHLQRQWRIADVLLRCSVCRDTVLRERRERRRQRLTAPRPCERRRKESTSTRHSWAKISSKKARIEAQERASARASYRKPGRFIVGFVKLCTMPP